MGAVAVVLLGTLGEGGGLAIPMQRVISAARRSMGIASPPPSPRVPSNTTATAPMEEDPDDFVRFMPYQVEVRFGSKIPCGRSREGEFQKIPSEQHSNTMRLHTTSCGHPGCHRVWRGPWGSFIGGSEGRQYFDLTECAEGKRLNQLISFIGGSEGRQYFDLTEC